VIDIACWVEARPCQNSSTRRESKRLVAYRGSGITHNMSDDEMPEDAYVINWSDFECVEPIGMAASPRLGGREFKAAWFGTEVAIKEVSGIKQEDVRLAALQEFEILRYLRPSLPRPPTSLISSHRLYLFVSP
jgi:hypothetical protein